jgi:hypothetical protein
MLNDARVEPDTAHCADLHKALERIAQLERAVESHGLIGQAMGILMCRYSITSEAAFAALTRASQHHNLKLRCLAEATIDTIAGRGVALPREVEEALEEILRAGETPDRAQPG